MEVRTTNCPTGQRSALGSVIKAPPSLHLHDGRMSLAVLTSQCGFEDRMQSVHSVALLVNGGCLGFWGLS